MGALDSLRQTLEATNAQAFQGLAFEHKKLDEAIQQLRAWLGSSGTRKPPSNLIHDALSRFYKVLRTENLRDTRLISYGCVEPFDERGHRLIEDAEGFPKLLDCVDRYRSEPRPFRRCYKGLLNGYFTYDPTAEWARKTGRQNWEELRVYLHSRTADLRGDGSQPDWVQAIAEHENLTTEDPCGRYGLALLNGEEGEFSDAQRKLEISEASWVTTQLVLAQVDAAINLGDSGFGGYISRLLDLLDKHRVVLNSGLARVLIRYHGCASAGLHPGLRDFSVVRWGNPWLSSNSARWNQVPEATRSMVADWLKLELIHSFFNLLAEDGSSDTRRLKFWQRYHKHIDDMYFALGRRAAKSTSRDFLDLRKRMDGRVLDLYAAGPPQNNAFIMCMGDYVVVEFGTKGNACFVFRRSQLPFALSGHVAGDATALKDARHVERLLHIDRSYQTWEKTFEATLAGLMSVRLTKDDKMPAGVGVSSGRAVAPPAAPAQLGNTLAEVPVFVSRPGTDPDYTSPRVDLDYSRRSLERFCAVRHFNVRDLNGIGGNLWVNTDDTDDHVSRQLRAWGFTHKQGKGWWRKGG